MSFHKRLGEVVLAREVRDRDNLHAIPKNGNLEIDNRRN